MAKSFQFANNKISLVLRFISSSNFVLSLPTFPFSDYEKFREPLSRQILLKKPKLKSVFTNAWKNVFTFIVEIDLRALFLDSVFIWLWDFINSVEYNLIDTFQL